MKNVVLDEEVKELSKKYNKRKEVILAMIKFCMKQNYNLKEIKEIIKGFYDRQEK